MPGSIIETLPLTDWNGPYEPAVKARAVAALESGGGGLVGTAADYLRFARMLLNKGELEGVRLLSPKTVALMTANHLPGGKEIADLSPSARKATNCWATSTMFFVRCNLL